MNILKPHINNKNISKLKLLNNKKCQQLSLENNTPLLFNKKSHKRIIKPLIYIKTDTGITRHFTPAAQEWYNSIYTYNHNYIKTLPNADKSLMSLLKSYFNSWVNPKFFTPKKREKFRWQRKPRFLKPIPARIRRASSKRVFVGKGELKHTNNKVILTFYLYSTQGMVLSNTYKRLSQGLFYPRNKLKKTITWNRAGHKIITYNRIFSVYEFSALRKHYLKYITLITSIITELNDILSNINTYYEDLTHLVEINVLTENEKHLIFNAKVNRFKLNYPSYYNYLFHVEHKYTKTWSIYIVLLKMYKLKFTNPFISKLNNLVNNIYNKKVVFNIVNLKKMHLNSDIFTQAVALKLENKNNKLYRVLKSSLRKFKTKPISKIDERRLGKRDKNVYLVNRIRNNIVSSMINDNAIRTISNLLSDYYTPVKELRLKIVKKWCTKVSSVSLKRYVLRTLKHMVVRGVRVEAKGRLTRRATASRSVFKMKWKGGLKNIDSSFRGWSAIMLRGIVKSNVQYSVTSSKNPNGAYGVKGWVSNK